MATQVKQEYESKMIKALGLPNTTYSFQITMRVGELSKGSCEFYLDSDMLANIETAMTVNVDSQSKERLLRMLDGD